MMLGKKKLIGSKEAMLSVLAPSIALPGMLRIHAAAPSINIVRKKTPSN